MADQPGAEPAGQAQACVWCPTAARSCPWARRRVSRQRRRSRMSSCARVVADGPRPRPLGRPRPRGPWLRTGGRPSIGPPPRPPPRRSWRRWPRSAAMRPRSSGGRRSPTMSVPRDWRWGRSADGGAAPPEGAAAPRAPAPVAAFGVAAMLQTIGALLLVAALVTASAVLWGRMQPWQQLALLWAMVAVVGVVAGLLSAPARHRQCPGRALGGVRLRGGRRGGAAVRRAGRALVSAAGHGDLRAGAGGRWAGRPLRLWSVAAAALVPITAALIAVWVSSALFATAGWPRLRGRAGRAASHRGGRQPGPLRPLVRSWRWRPGCRGAGPCRRTCWAAGRHRCGWPRSAWSRRALRLGWFGWRRCRCWSRGLRRPGAGVGGVGGSGGGHAGGGSARRVAVAGPARRRSARRRGRGVACGAACGSRWSPCCRPCWRLPWPRCCWWRSGGSGHGPIGGGCWAWGWPRSPRPSWPRTGAGGPHRHCRPARRSRRGRAVGRRLRRAADRHRRQRPARFAALVAWHGAAVAAAGRRRQRLGRSG